MFAEDRWKAEMHRREIEEFAPEENLSVSAGRGGSGDGKRNSRRTKTEKCLAETERILKGIKNLNSGVRPVAALMIFNRLFRRDSSRRKEKEMDRIIRRIGRLSRLESEFERSPLIPSFGIEIECFTKYLNDEKTGILDRLRIHNEAERHDGLWEVNPVPNFHPSVQARIIRELIGLRAIPARRGGRKKTLSGKKVYSLHLNFGVPPELEHLSNSDWEYGDKYDDALLKLSDALVYAFSSPRRLELRKTNISFMIVRAEKIRNRKYRKSRAPHRLELRAVEFRDFSSYRMLFEAQIMAVMLFSWAKKKTGLRLKPAERKLARAWKEFSAGFGEIIRGYDLAGYNLVDGDKDDIGRVTALLRATKLRADCRALIRACCARAGKIIFQKK